MKVCVFGQIDNTEKIISLIRPEHTIVFQENIAFPEGLPEVHDRGETTEKASEITYITDATHRELLLQRGVSDKQVLDYTMFGNLTFTNPILGFSNRHDAILFGMSHSECGINENILEGFTYYKESAPSLDLFLHLNFLSLLYAKHSEEMKKIRRFVFELPYYIFNYDLSKFGDFTLSKLNYFDCIQNYHHLVERSDYSNIMYKYNMYKEIMIDGVLAPSQSTMNRESIIKRTYHNIYNSIQIINNHDKVWERVYPDTIAENKEHWDTIVKKIESKSPAAEIILLIMPFNPLFKKMKEKSINIQKDIFYKNIGLDKDHIFDDFYREIPYYWYDDHCHISKRKADRYTEIINRRLCTI